MKIHWVPQQFACRIIYFVVILWKDFLPANGNDPTTGDTTVDELTVNSVDRNELLNIVYGVLNGTKTNSTSFTISLNFNNASVIINNLSIGDCPDDTITKNKRPINNTRDDYTLIQEVGLYKLHTRTLSWYGAYKACVDENAHLVVINSMKEADLLLQLLKGNENIESVYIGAHDMFREGDWITVNGESLERAGYNKWAPGEPNNIEGNEHCAVFRKSGLMNDIPCSFERNYICEVSL